MADIRIFEMGDISRNGTVRPSVWSAKQSVTIGASSAQSVGFSENTLYVTVQADADCHVEIGPNPTATVASWKIAAGRESDFEVNAGHKLAVIQA